VDCEVTSATSAIQSPSLETSATARNAARPARRETPTPCATPLDCALIRLLYDQAARTLVGATLAPLLATPFLWDRVPATLLVSWLAAIGVITLERLLLLRAYRRQRPDDSILCRWRDHFLVGGLLTGLAWGLMGAYVAWLGTSLEEALFLCLLVGTVVLSL
jgi:hypothetical protein